MVANPNTYGVISNPEPIWSCEGLPLESCMDVDSEYGGRDNNIIARPNKRQKRANATMTDLPVELLIEICRHVWPGDLLSLSWTCKSLRSCFMSKSRKSLWQDVLKNIQNLPPCPPGFTEPQYSQVLFSGCCTACGTTKKPQMDLILLVRLCASCQKQRLVNLVNTQEVPVNIREYIHKSNVFGKGKRGQLPDACVLKSNVAEVIKAFERVKFEGDRAVEDLQKQIMAIVLERRKQSERIIRALELFENTIAWERKTNQMERKEEIQRRCIDSFQIVQEDLHFPWDSPWRQEWCKILNKRNFLSNDEWRTIRPKLQKLLESNRRFRLAKEEETCRLIQPNYQDQKILCVFVDPVAETLYGVDGISVLI